MRLARINDYKRRIQERAADWSLQLKRFSVQDVPSVGTAEVALATPFVILSGPNGVGKTTLLRALWAAASCQDVQPTPGGKIKLTTGTAALDFNWKGDALTSEVAFANGKASGGAELPVPVIHLDTSVDPLRYQEFYCSFETTEELLNGVGGNKVEARSLADVNYIAKRDYTDLTVYEIEGQGRATPFFEVSLGADRYDSRTMGAGELSILHTWWNVEQAPQDALVLIEEPETFLSPASQLGLSHFLLAATVEKKLVTVVTSHSPQIVDSVSDRHRFFVYRQGASVRFATQPTSPALLKTIGILPKVDTIMMVEDKAAEVFLSSLLEKYDPQLRRRVEIKNQQGDGNIVAVLDKVGNLFKSVPIIGVFDGDLRGKVKKTVEAFSAYLPGTQAIEIIFRDMIVADIAGASDALSRPKLGEALFQLEGADHHDWYRGLCDNLSLTEEQLFLPLFNMWIARDENAAEAEKSVAEINLALRGAGGTNAVEMPIVKAGLLK